MDSEGLKTENNGHMLVTMTMTRTDKSIAAGKFKAECLALLDRVAATGQGLIVTKRGKAVARVVPIREAAPPSLLGSVTFHGDIVAPLGEAWEADA